MSSGMHFFVVDDDADQLEFVSTQIECAGHRVTTSRSSVAALEKIPAAAPDCILLDIMMPEMDGLELCEKLRENPALASTKIVILTAKAYDQDKRKAKAIGADAYIEKFAFANDPMALFDKVSELVADQITMTFWGVRGTLPVPGHDSLRYGGNTNCVTLEFQNEHFFIFDAGTGIKALSDQVLARFQGKPRMKAKIFISHPHWDHINALPFFVPLFIPGNDFEILGARHGRTSMEQLISDQMDGVYFPVTVQEFGARLAFRDLGEERLELDGITVETLLLTHPGNCLGYSISYNDSKICYITDNELYLPDSPHHSVDFENRLTRFTKGADALIMDTTYFDEEYPKKVGWGHSCVSQVVDIAHRAEAKTLYLYHHDPDQKDDDIDRKLEVARKLLEERGSDTRCEAPAEGDVIKV